MFVRFALVAGLLVTVGEFHRAEVRSLEALQRADAERARLEQQTLQARLKTLEAQVEPHFLFNTLANLRRLYETDPEAGEAMMERLMRYLQTALPSMRDERSTLAREAQLIEAYLELQQVRMGRRLAYGIDIAPALRPLQVPPMMLLTLVENAIKHGLAPQREGGRVDVRARLDGPQLRLEVADTGRGFGGGTSGGGTGLANIRARLAARFGTAAEITLTAGAPRGLLAAIRMPVLP
jgi:sensor histidine kinase YesM